MKDLKYINQFTDKTGRVRTYFRRPGQSAIALPNDFDSPVFKRRYKALLIEIPPEVRRKRARIKQRRLEIRMLRKDQARAGVYLLLHRGKVVYVGSSEDMERRVADHRKNGRAFDQAFFIATRADQRTMLERILIQAILPEQNRNGTRDLQTLVTNSFALPSK